MADGTSPVPGGTQDVFRARSNPVPLPMIVRAEGVRMWDEDGRDYIDVSSGPVVSNIGHGNARVADAMAAQARTLDFAYASQARHHPNEALAAKIAGMAGPGYERVCFGSGGSESMEIALKFYRMLALATGEPQRRHVISLMPSYHGATLGMLGVTGDPAVEPFIDGFALPQPKVPAPLQYRVPENHTAQTWRAACAEALDARIRELGAENVLAFVVEPVGGLSTGGMPLEEDYANRIREICTAHGIALIYDEVLCGSGRTGTFLASHAWPDARADAVVLAKGLAAGYAPLSASLFPAETVDRLSALTGYPFLHTYTANPIASATALAVLEETERLDLFAAARDRGAYLKARLEEMGRSHPSFGELRGRGLLMGLELVTDRETKAMFPANFTPADHLRVAGLAEGLLIYSRRTAGGAYGDWVMIAPPLTISEAECDELVARLDRTLTAFEAAAAPHMGG